MRQVPEHSTPLLCGKHILLGITGSVAAQKSILLAQQLLQQGAEVKIILTASAMKFLQPNDFLGLGNDAVYTDIFADDINVMDHITLAKWADAFVIAPASAAVISRCATGLADQLLSLVYTATMAPTFMAPAMNQQMWANHAVQQNVHTLQRAGCVFLGPAFGEQACGDVGLGRFLEPTVIVQYLQSYFQQVAKNLNVLITAGPTQEAIDPVRYLSNHSSGKMGYALATAFTQQGAKVTLISGPTSLPLPPVKQMVNTVSTAEMQAAVIQQLSEQHIAITAAAVADYRVANANTQKIKKTTESLELKLIKNPDILQSIRQQRENIYLVGFALETEQLITHAKQKLTNKNLDMIIANEFSAHNKVFGSDDNEIRVLEKNDTATHFPRQDKKLLAQKLVKLICSRILPAL